MPQRVICIGGGSVGARTAAMLGDYGHDPVVIEQDPNRCAQLHAPRLGVVIEGDGRRRPILSQADPERADVVAALTGDGVTNRLVCERVESMADGIRTVARGPPREGEPGGPDRPVQPAVAGAKAAANAVLGAGARLRDLPATGLDIAEFAVDPRAPAARRELRETSFPSGSTVVADAESMTVTEPDTELRPGHRYLVAVEPHAASEVRALLRG